MDSLKAAIQSKKNAVKTDAAGRVNKYQRRGDLTTGGNSRRLATGVDAGTSSTVAVVASSGNSNASEIGKDDKGTKQEKNDVDLAQGPRESATVAADDSSSSVSALRKNEPPLSSEAIKKALRARREPITLFGESDMDRFRRYQEVMEKIPTLEASRQDTFGDAMRQLAAGTGSHKIKSLLRRNKGGNAVDDDDDEDRREQEEGAETRPGESKKSDKKGKKSKRSAEDADVGGDEDDEGGKKSKKSKKKKERPAPSRDDKAAFIRFVLKRYLAEWETELNARTEKECRSMAGRTMTATYVQCVDHIKPLFKLLKKNLLASEILDSVHEIICFLEDREYVRAHDSYIMLSIGNAPWPMGVTNVGIHERAGRSKIFAHHVAHVLNDETQRKYIQSVKRIMSFVQEKYPTAPSKMVST